jgi:hypothetical protein
MTIPPPTPEQWKRIPERIRWRIFLLVLFARLFPDLVAPLHFAMLASLCMFVMLPVMPHHIMAIPTVIGGGLAGGLLLMGGRQYGKSKI